MKEELPRVRRRFPREAPHHVDFWNTERALGDLLQRETALAREGALGDFNDVGEAEEAGSFAPEVALLSSEVPRTCGVFLSAVL